MNGRRDFRCEVTRKSSNNVSNLVVQLALIAPAVIWIFKERELTEWTDKLLLSSLILSSLSVLSSLVQYMITTIVNLYFSQSVNSSKDIPLVWARVTLGLWLFKCLLVLLSYVMIAIVLISLW